MIADLDIGGVLVPGLLVLAVLALAGTVAVLRLLAAIRAHRLVAGWALIEPALFVIILGLLVQYLPTNGICP